MRVTAQPDGRPPKILWQNAEIFLTMATGFGREQIEWDH